ncbi:DoxX family protein [Haloarchaeobius amylolyticus]|uniref:DoxX family protein n=1 Tax=Haloarchaeobius amylolyticus TaxID=1198296 RepID=UPI002270C810|nr:DoxX family protein [Haloarchaeobius amylolyticus]
MALELTGSAGLVLLAARVLVGGVLAFMGLNHFMNTEDMAGYAAMKGVPAPELAVTFSGGMLVLGGLSIVLGAYAAIGAGAIVVFLLVTTPMMHDFWTMEDPEQQQNEMTAFLKNVVMLGAALGFLVLAGTDWPYAVGVGL